MSTKPKKNAHHHGNLRAALIDAGIELLEEGGLEALTLRKCAAKAGVSHAAPAHHFDGLPGLKAAIAIQSFSMFSQSMSEAAAAGDPSPRGVLRSICRGYLEFGISHPALLKTMFGLGATEALKYDLQGAGRRAYDILREACAPFVPDGTAPEIVEAQVWSLIHGFTLLYIGGQFVHPLPLSIEDGPFDQVTALLDHLGASAP